MSTETLGAEDASASAPRSPEPAPPARAEVAVTSRAGTITLARHGEPNISRKVKLCAAEYAVWWARYEETGLLPGQAVPEALRVTARAAGLILCSTRPRAIESAQAVAQGRELEIDIRFIEAPLPPPHWPAWFKLSPRHWGVVSRFWWWFFDHHDGQERRKAAVIRADEAADYLMGLAGAGEDVLLIAHGFFNYMIGRSLRRRGWFLAENQGHDYWAARRYVAARG